MILTKLIYPTYYKVYRIPKTSEVDFEAMRKKNYTEEAISFFEENNHNYASGFTEPIDTTINRWLEENEKKISVVDIKYQGYADDNSNMSALIIYRKLA